MEDKTPRRPRHIIPGWLSWWWGVPGNGIDFQPSVRLFGVAWRMTFIGVMRVSRSDT